MTLEQWIAFGSFVVVVTGAFIQVFRVRNEDVKNRADAFEAMSSTIGNLGDEVRELRKENQEQNKRITEQDRVIRELQGRNEVNARLVETLQASLNELIVGVDILTHQLREAKIEPKWTRRKTGNLQ